MRALRRASRFRPLSLSTQAGDRQAEEEDDGDSSLSESELSEDKDIGKASHGFVYLMEKERLKNAVSKLLQVITEGRLFTVPVRDIIDKKFEGGKELGEKEILAASHILIKKGIYFRAKDLLEWWESSRKSDLTDRYYATRLDYILKVDGLNAGRDYVNQIPESCRGKNVYQSLLANYVARRSVRRAEQAFDQLKMRFPLSSFACNQLLSLYLLCGEKKMDDVWLLMEKENVKPTMFTFKLLIDAKGKSNDIPGMEKIVETMKAKGFGPDKCMQCALAKYYSAAGMKDKAKSVLKEVEGGDLEQNRWTVPSLLPLYAAIGEAEEVERLWKVCKSNPSVSEGVAAIDAWGVLRKFDAAGDIVSSLRKSGRLTSEIEDAYFRLFRKYPSKEETQLKHQLSSYQALMRQYAKSGDVHNAEKTLYRLRQLEYTGRGRPYLQLIEAYINGNVRAYGMRERLKGDEIVISDNMEEKLAVVDPFRGTVLSDRLD